jgi:hypothetical protein
MAMKAVASVFASDPYKCYAECEKLDYQDLIVTKCNHVFCRACLVQSLESKRSCPMDQKDLSLITPKNIREKSEDPRIDQTSINQGMQYNSFKSLLEIFIYYIQNNYSVLEEKLTAEKALKLLSCEMLKADKSKVKPNSQELEEDQCAICITVPFPQMYFIIKDKDPTRVGRFLHEDCWQKIVDDKSLILEISARKMAIVAEQLPLPEALPKEPYKPASPAKVFFMAIILPMSLWALAMNTRIYHNKSFVLFVLSIPALIIFKTLSFILNGIKAAFTPSLPRKHP